MERNSFSIGIVSLVKSARGLCTKFIEPRSVSEDDRRRERILNIILLGSIIGIAILDGTVLYYSVLEGAKYSGISFGSFSAILAFFVLLYVLSRRGSFVIASYLFTAAYFLSISYAEYQWGVGLPAALLGYALLITMASILISTRFGFIVTAVVSLFIIVLWHIQFHGIMPAAQSSVPNESDALVFAVLFGLLTTVAWLSNREMEKSLVRVRESEMALKEERDLLEEKVDERTRELRAAQLEKIDHLYRFAEFGQLASGLFHDLTSILGAVSLQVERDSQVSLENAFSVQAEINRFTEAVRKQLKREDTKEFFSLAEGIEHAMQLLTHKCNVEHIKISFEQVGTLPDFFGNASKFHQVVVNILMNAIEAFGDIAHEPKGGRRIFIRLTSAGNVAIDIEDNGSGIPAAIRAKIFEPFFTTKQGGKEGNQGIGIGLAITKHVIEKDFGGTIEAGDAEGDGEQRGSVFKIRFPMNYGSENNTAKNILDDNERDRGHQT